MDSATPYNPRTLIIIPTYNEADNIERIIPAVLEEVPEVHVLVVDDGSPDGTGRLADAIAHQDERVFVMHRTSKDGLGKAYIAGFQWALEQDYDVMFEMDADFSHQPRYLGSMIRNTRDYDVVVGSRYVQGGGTENWGPGRRFISQGGSLYARTVLGVRVKDLTSGFIAWRREVLQQLDLNAITATGYGFQIEMKYRAVQNGFKLLEVPITFPDREAGESKMSANIFTEALSLIWKIRLS